MKNLSEKLVLVTFVCLFLYGCGSKNEPLKSVPELLAGEESKSWRLTGLGLDGFPLADVDDPCYVDNIYSFLRDNAYAFDYGEELCDEQDDDAEEGSWEIVGVNSDSLNLRIPFFDDFIDRPFSKYKIESINSNEMILYNGILRERYNKVD